MKDVLIADDVAIPVPEEVVRLLDEIWEICSRAKHSDHVATALWLMLLSLLMQMHECTLEEAIKHAQDLVEYTKLCTSNTVAAQSPSH